MKIQGTGLLRYLGFIKAYVGALYLEEESSIMDVLSDKPKRLEVEYFHALKGKDFGITTNKVIAKNADPQTLQRIQPQIDYHNSLYEDVQPGDRYSLTYIPGRGTELALNGKTKGIIKGADFASALFSRWLGEFPMNKQFSSDFLRSLRNDISIDKLIRMSSELPWKEREGFLRFLCPLCNEFHTATNPKTNLARCFRCQKNFIRSALHCVEAFGIRRLGGGQTAPQLLLDHGDLRPVLGEDDPAEIPDELVPVIGGLQRGDRHPDLRVSRCSTDPQESWKDQVPESRRAASRWLVYRSLCSILEAAKNSHKQGPAK